MRTIEAHQQYECLARFVHRAARWRDRARPTELTLHKPLRTRPGDPPSEDGAHALNIWLADRVLARAPRRVLDLGCGFGATLFTLAERHAAEYHGISASSYQIEVARRLAATAPSPARFGFTCGDFEEVDPGTGFDAIVAIESLGYAVDPGALAGRLRSALATGGRLYVIDDWKAREDAGLGPAGERFLQLWRRPRLASFEAFTEVMRGAGWREIENVDLTAQVPGVADPPARARWLLLRLLNSLPLGKCARLLSAAYLGGCYLEQLYARRLVHYRYAAFAPDRS